MNKEQQIIADLYEVIRSQNVVISYLVATDNALVNTLANDPALPSFVKNFQKHHTHSAKHPEGTLAESLVELQRMLGAIGEKLKQDIGGWNN